MADSKRRLLLLSSSRTPGAEYLQHAHGFLHDFLGARIKRVTFVPYARVSSSHEEYAERVRANFAAIGYEVERLSDAGNAARALARAEGLVVGGGNTFQLLHELYARKLLQPMRERLLDGLPYVGWSAGANIACPTVCTSNDMPIVWPAQCIALDLVPFQINPHYTDIRLADHHGETRAERLQEFTHLNPLVPVVGLREGSALRIEGDTIQLLGPYLARIFNHGTSRETSPQEPLDFLLAGNH